MEFVEIAIEGLKGFPGLTRLALKPGLNAMPAAGGKEGAIVAVLLDVLYPKGSESKLEGKIDPDASAARVAVFLTGRDGRQFRLLRDLKSGRLNLLCQATGGFQPLADEAQLVAQAVTAQVGFPQEDVFRGLLVTRRNDLPSTLPDAPQVAAPSTSAAAPRPAASQFSKMSREQQTALLAEIRGQLAKADEIKELEFELDGLQKKVFEFDDELREIDSLKLKLQEYEAELSRHAEYEGLPDDLPQQREHLLRAANLRQGRLKELKAKEDTLKGQLDRNLASAEGVVALSSLAFADPKVMWGTLGGLVALMLAAGGTYVFEPFRYLAVAGLGGLGAALLGTLRFIGDVESCAYVKFELKRIEEERSGENNRYELEESAFNAVLRQHNLSLQDLPVIESGLLKYRKAKAAHDEALEKLNQARDAKKSVLEAREKLKVDVKTMEQELYSTGGYVVNRAELEEKAELLEVELGLREGMSDRHESFTPAYGTPAIAPSAANVDDDPATDLMRRVVACAQDVMLSDIDSVLSAAAPRAAQYVAGLSDRRFSQVVFGPRGEPSVIEATTGKTVPLAALTPGDKDVVYLAVKLTLVELTLKRQKYPVIVERAFDGLAETKAPLLAKVIAFLAGQTQLIVVTDKPALVPAANLVRLP